MQYDPATDSVTVRLDVRAITQHAAARRQATDKTPIDQTMDTLATIGREGRAAAKKAHAAELAAALERGRQG